jgi:hypothetical protein
MLYHIIKIAFLNPPLSPFGKGGISPSLWIKRNYKGFEKALRLFFKDA